MSVTQNFCDSYNMELVFRQMEAHGSSVHTHIHTRTHTTCTSSTANVALAVGADAATFPRAVAEARHPTAEAGVGGGLGAAIALAGGARWSCEGARV